MIIKYGVDILQSLDVTELFTKHFIKDGVFKINKQTALSSDCTDHHRGYHKNIIIIDDTNKTGDNILFTFNEIKLVDTDITYNIPPNINCVSGDEPTIHVVLCCWKRTIFLKRQLLSINRQINANELHVHLVNNNKEAHDEITEIINKLHSNLVFKISLSSYDNRYSCFQRYFYIRDVLLVNYKLDYVIIIDDDQEFSICWFNYLWNRRKLKSMVCWYGKIWKLGKYNYWKDPDLFLPHCLRNNKRYINKFKYGGPGGSIIDVEIFNKESILWDIPDDLPDSINIYQLDDIWISYIIDKLNWNIIRSFLPITPINDKLISKTAISPMVKEGKSLLMSYLVENKNMRYTITCN